MPDDPVHQYNPSACQADFTYTITPVAVQIQDTGKGKKSVAEDLEAVLRKIEHWHQGSIAAFKIMYRDEHGVWNGIRWNVSVLPTPYLFVSPLFGRLRGLTANQEILGQTEI